MNKGEFLDQLDRGFKNFIDDMVKESEQIQQELKPVGPEEEFRIKNEVNKYTEKYVNDLNSKVFIDMINDMRSYKDGVFSCNFRVCDKIITDYVFIDSKTYVE